MKPAVSQIYDRVFKHPKMSAVGVLGSVLGFALMFPQYFVHYPIVLDLAKFAAIGGFAAFGLASKDVVFGKKDGS